MSAGWLIIGHYGGSNTGDELMLAALVSAAGEDLGSGTTVLTRTGELPPALAGTGLRAIPPRPAAVVRALRASTGVILGGGTHFHDDYTFARRLRHLRYLSRIVAVCALARAMGRRVLWLGMGFGPCERLATRWLARAGLATCDRVTVRDAASLEEVRGWTDDSKLELAFDLAGLLADPPADHADSAGREVLGISATTAATSRSTGRERDAAFWPELGRAVADELRARPELRVKIFVFRGGEREDDLGLSRLLHDAVAAADPQRVELLDYDPDPQRTLREVARCTAFAATRYHSLLLAYLGGCRLLGLAYHRKVRDLADELGLGGAATVDLSSGSAEQLRSALRALLDGSNACRPKLPLGEARRRASVNLAPLSDGQGA